METQACRSSSVRMDIPHPAKHRSLVFWQLTIPETPRMDPQLLPIQVPNLQHGKLGKEGVGMVHTPSPSHQPCKALLVPEQSLPKGDIPPTLKVPPDHEAVLQMWEDQAIVEREESPPTQYCPSPTQYPQELPNLSLNLPNMTRPP